jgi:trigger factor
MKITTEKLENCQMALTIEVEANELDGAMNEAYHRLVSKVSIPGFRKGKASRAILVQHIGKKSLLDEALERLIPQLYQQAVTAHKIEPIAEPQIEVIQTEPVIFKAVAPLKPEIKLGDYHGIKIAPDAVEPGDKELAAAIGQLQEKQGVWMPVARPIRLGDLVAMDITAEVEGKPWLDHKGIEYEVKEDSFIPGFAENLVSMDKNKEKNFSLIIPASYNIKEVAGKGSLFKVMVTEIKEKQLPEINDEFAKSCDYPDLEAMKQQVFADLKAKAEKENLLKLREEVIDAVVKCSEVCYPPILEKEEVDRLFRDEIRSLGFTEVRDYLNKTGKSVEEIRERLRPIARQRIIHSLILDRVAEEEKIEIGDPEVDNKIQETMESSEDKEKAQQFLNLPQIREAVKESLRSEKTINCLVEIAARKEE